MKYTIQINQLAIIQNELNIKGTTLDTWALLDFLALCSATHEKLGKNGEFWFWVNFNYIQYALPLCNFNEQKIKKHLDLLEKIGLIDLSTDNGRDDNKDSLFYKLNKDKMGDILC